MYFSWNKTPHTVADDPGFPGTSHPKRWARNLLLGQNKSPKTERKWNKLDGEGPCRSLESAIIIRESDLPLRPTSVNIPWSMAAMYVKITRPSSWSV